MSNIRNVFLNSDGFLGAVLLAFWREIQPTTDAYVRLPACSNLHTERFEMSLTAR